MATIKRELTSRKDGDGRAELLLRFTIRRGLQWRLHTTLRINPDNWDAENNRSRFPRLNRPLINELRELDGKIQGLEKYLYSLIDTENVEYFTRENLEERIEKFLYPPVEADGSKGKRRGPTFFDIMEDFIEKRRISDWRKKRYHVLRRALKRFELYRKKRRRKDPEIDLKTFSTQDLMDFEAFLRNEPEIFKKYPEIFKKFPSDTRKERKAPKPQAKGDNTIINIFSCFRSFYKDCIDQGLVEVSPFAKYKGCTTEHYGTPYYLTLEERDKIADWDLSASPCDEVQRDIFIFHTLVGCRVSDLMRLTESNIINGALEYIASKTKHARANTIRVPLTKRAKDLIAKYKGKDPDGRLFPFISQQKYNDAIKRVFTKCEVTRMVTILNPTTGIEEQQPINKIASSHIARRTFVGNLYKKVKDPNLVGALSGHKEGSRAFARYREIDEDLKREVMDFLE